MSCYQLRPANEFVANVLNNQVANWVLHSYVVEADADRNFISSLPGRTSIITAGRSSGPPRLPLAPGTDMELLKQTGYAGPLDEFVECPDLVRQELRNFVRRTIEFSLPSAPYPLSTTQEPTTQNPLRF